MTIAVGAGYKLLYMCLRCFGKWTGNSVNNDKTQVYCHQLFCTAALSVGVSYEVNHTQQSVCVCVCVCVHSFTCPTVDEQL